jgi:hypothetical protein
MALSILEEMDACNLPRGQFIWDQALKALHSAGMHKDLEVVLQNMRDDGFEPSKATMRTINLSSQGES